MVRGLAKLSLSMRSPLSPPFYVVLLTISSALDPAVMCCGVAARATNAIPLQIGSRTYHLTWIIDQAGSPWKEQKNLVGRRWLLERCTE